MLSVLRNPTYARLFAAQVLALFGTGILTVALGLLAFDLAGERGGAVLGTAMTIKIAAYVFFAPLVSAVVGRLPRKAVLIGADAVRGLTALCLPFVTEAWEIYALIFLLQAASATFTPTFQALIPAVLPDERDYTRAQSWSRIAYDMESILSPLAAAALLSLISFHNLFSVTAAGFACSLLLVAATRLPRVADSARGSLWRRTTAGTRIFAANPTLRALLALDLVVACAYATVLINTVVLVKGPLGLGDAELGIALAVFGAGSLAVALALPRWIDARGERQAMLAGSTVVVAGLAGTLLVSQGPPGAASWPGLLASWLLLGAGTSMISTPAGILLRRASSPETRTAVFAAQFSLSHACYLLTYPLAGLAGAALGLGTAASLMLFLGLVGTAAAVVLYPRRTPRLVR